MKAFTLYSTTRQITGFKKSSIWTEVLKKDLVKILDEKEARLRKNGYLVSRINDSVMYVNRNFDIENDGIVGQLNIVFTIEEVTF